MAIVSILLPVYNAESTISETIQSIINQTYKDWELYIDVYKRQAFINYLFKDGLLTALKKTFSVLRR